MHLAMHQAKNKTYINAVGTKLAQQRRRHYASDHAANKKYKIYQCSCHKLAQQRTRNMAIVHVSRKKKTINQCSCLKTGATDNEE